MLHAPGEIPRLSKYSFKMPMHQEMVLSVKPKMVVASEGLARYPPERRKCFFGHERKLQFFKKYSQNNCEYECLVNFTLSSCGCVKFSMPRNSSTNICTQTDMDCYDKCENSLAIKELSERSDAGLSQKITGKTICNCLPSCTSISYDAEVSQATYEFKKVLEAYGEDLNEFPGAIFSRLVIIFREAHFNTVMRSEFFSLADFFATCGGLLGKLRIKINQTQPKLLFLH